MLKKSQYWKVLNLKDLIKNTVNLWAKGKCSMPKLFLYGLVIVYSAVNSAPAVFLQQKSRIEIHQALLWDKFEIQIYVPNTEDEQQRFPVLYIMDSQHYMNLAIGIQESLTHRNSSLAKFIVVAIDTSIIGD